MYLMDTSLRLCMRWKQEGRDGILAGNSPLYTHIYICNNSVCFGAIHTLDHQIERIFFRRLREFINVVYASS